MTREKLKKCRICLAENFRMVLVASKNLQELYEKLTDVPFVTEDRRPILACFICFTKLKQCYQFQRKCLEAEELLVPMLNDDYETKPLMNHGLLEFSSGFNITPTVHMSIVDQCQTETNAIGAFPAVFDILPDIIEPKKEQQELEPEYVEDDVPLMELKIEMGEEQDVFKTKRRARETTSTMMRDKDGASGRLDELIQPKDERHSDEGEPESFDDEAPLMELKIEIEEEQEVFKNKRSARETTSATVPKKPKLEDVPEITAEQKKNEKSKSKVIRTIQKRTSKPDTYIKEPYKSDQPNFHPVKNNIQHTRMQIAETPYKCGLCQRYFTKQNGLTKHKRIHTGEKPFKCHLCQSSFIEKSALTNHIRVHTGEKPFKCHICQCSFRQTGTLKTHIRQHTGVKAYKCDICQRSFGEKNTLKNHIRTHTGEKPFKCHICQSSFRQSSHLSIHIRQHTGEKPYKCNICQRRFNQKCDLTKHTRIHTGEKPFICDVCERSFNQKSALTKHRRLHTGEKPYECDVCKRCFRDKRNLTKHIC